MENTDISLILLMCFLILLVKSRENLEDTEVVCCKIEGQKVSVFSSSLNSPYVKECKDRRDWEIVALTDNRFQQLLTISY